MRLTESLMAAFDAANDSTYRPLRKELPNLMISGTQHVLLVSIIFTYCTVERGLSDGVAVIVTWHPAQTLSLDSPLRTCSNASA